MKKIISLILSISVLALLVGCGSKSTVASTDTASSETAAKPKQKLILCTNAEFPPYEYKEGGEYVGIDIECAKLIGEKLNAEIEIMDIAFDSLIPTIMSGKADFAMAGMTVTEDRLKNIDFTHTYQTAVQTIVVPQNSDITSVDDLSDKKIGVQTGTTADIYCSDDFGDEAVERYSKIIDGFQAMKAGKVDACVVDDQVAKAIVAQDGGSFKILSSAYAEEEYAIAVKKGNTELLNKLNNAIDEIKGSGQLLQIVNKYIH